MHTVEELPSDRKGHAKTNFYYYSSLYAFGPLSSHMPAPRKGTSVGRLPGSKRRKVNYNVKKIQQEQFMKARIEGDSSKRKEGENGENGEQPMTDEERLLSALEMKKANKRFEELDRENFNNQVRLEIPKAITNLHRMRTTKPSVAVRRILNSKKTWTNYIDEIDKREIRKIRRLESKPSTATTKKLCTICGNISFSRCTKCGARVCSLKCMQIHQETRCTNV